MQSTIILAEIQLPAQAKAVAPGSLYAALVGVKDRRAKRGRRYEAALVLTLLLLAKLAQEEKLSGIAQWVRLRRGWLETVLPLPRGQLPCANTYAYVCSHLDMNELNERLAAFFAGLWEPEVSQAAREHLVLDGKELRGSRRQTPGQPAATQVLSVYSVNRQMVLRQVAIAGKGHERRIALALLPELDLRGRLVSADALHTQPAWCKQVLAQGGAYLLLVKRNQRLLYQDIALLFSQTPVPWLPEASAQTVEQTHGRLAVRRLRSSGELNDYLAPKWPGVAQVFQLQRFTTRHGRTSRETVYGLTSLTADQAPPHRILRLVRTNWHIENRLHWRRDVTLGEDQCTVSRGQVPQVLALLNSALLALMDWCGVKNLAAQRRIFAACPDQALALLLLPL